MALFLIPAALLAAMAWALASWLRKEALKGEKHQERDFKTPPVLDIWSRE